MDGRDILRIRQSAGVSQQALSDALGLVQRGTLTDKGVISVDEMTPIVKMLRNIHTRKNRRHPDGTSTGTYMDKAFVRLDKAIARGKTCYGICGSKPCAHRGKHTLQEPCRGCKRKDRWEGE
jgi:hypothetical protein